jgi:thermitase
VLAPTAASAAVADAEIIVKRRAGLIAAEHAAAGVEIVRNLPVDDVQVVEAPPGERDAALAALRADPDVMWAEPNLPVRAFTSDPYWPSSGD